MVSSRLRPVDRLYGRVVPWTFALAAGLVVTACVSGGGGGRPVLAPAPSAAPVPSAAPALGDLQRLFESGHYEEVLAGVPANAETVEPQAAHFAAHALARLDRRDAARERFERLEREAAPEAWQVVGRLAAARLASDRDGQARAEAEAAAMPDEPFVQYELGLVYLADGQAERAASAFGRTLAGAPSYAYAHYHAGLAAEQLRRASELVAHFEAFIRLAPHAPERPAVESILRTLRGG